MGEVKKPYMAKSLTNKLYMKQQWYGLKMKEDVNLLEHINVFNKLLDQLHKIDVKVEEEDIALLLPASLPNYYNNMVTTLLFGISTINLEDIMASLLSNKI